MSQHKVNTGTLIRQTMLYACLLLLSGLFLPVVPELKANTCPENVAGNYYPADLFNPASPNFRNFSPREDFPVHPVTKKQAAGQPGSLPLSDQCFFKEGRKAVADKGPEPGLIAFAGVFLEDPVSTKSPVSRLPFLEFTSWKGNCTRIRPPPKM